MALVVKNLPVNAGVLREVGLITGLGRSTGGGHGNPLQYFCLEKSMDRGAWQLLWGHKESDMTEVIWHTHNPPAPFSGLPFLTSSYILYSLNSLYSQRYLLKLTDTVTNL